MSSLLSQICLNECGRLISIGCQILNWSGEKKYNESPESYQELT